MEKSNGWKVLVAGIIVWGVVEIVDILANAKKEEKGR